MMLISFFLKKTDMIFILLNVLCSSLLFVSFRCEVCCVCYILGVLHGIGVLTVTFSFSYQKFLILLCNVCKC